MVVTEELGLQGLVLLEGGFEAGVLVLLALNLGLGVVKEFPKQYQAKANWFTFPKAPGHCEKAGSEALSAASAIEMAINIADSSGQ